MSAIASIIMSLDRDQLVQEISNLVSHVEGINDERDSVPILIGIRERWEKLMRTPEGYEKDDICKYLDSIGAWYFLPYMAGFGKSGVPDIVACIRGYFVSIEVKREGKMPTKLQTARAHEIYHAGGTPIWGTANRVIEQLKELNFSR